MREMKDSGIEWIGYIPEKWKIGKVKYVANLLNGDRGKNYPSGNDFVEKGIPFITSFDLDGKEVDYSNVNYISIERYYLLRGIKIQKGDIIYCLRGSVGKNAIATKDGGTVASSLVGIRTFSEKVKPDFLSYLLNSQIESINRNLVTTGSVSANISAENVGSYKIILPPLEEQERIVKFLDDKTSKIDSLITTKEKQIELLNEYKQSLISETVTKGLNPNVKMKDSGVEWIGEIPEHWNLGNAKHYVNFVNGVSIKQEKLNFEKGVRYLRTNDINTVSSISKDKVFYESEIAEFPYKNKDDFIICFDGFNKILGKGTLALYTDEGEGIYCSEINKVESKYQNILIDKFVQYAIGTGNNLHTIISNAKGSVVQHSGHSKRILKITIPPIEEQKEIVEFLNYKTSQINKIIKNIQQEINKFKEYKESLVFEAVTGKIDISKPIAK